MLSHDVVRYARSRLLTPAFLAICGICAAFVLGFKGPTPAGQVMPVIGATMLALVGFRLWDDLADLPMDRQAHPARVLCRTEQLALFRFVAAIAAGSPLLVFRQTEQAAWACYLPYCIALAATYGSTRSTTPAAGWRPARMVRLAVVLMKYPVVCLSALLALGPLVQGTSVIQTLLLLYVAVAAHEVVSHRPSVDSSSEDSLSN